MGHVFFFFDFWLQAIPFCRSWDCIKIILEVSNVKLSLVKICGSDSRKKQNNLFNSYLFELRSWKLPLGVGDRGNSETSTVWHFNSSSRTQSIWTYHKPIKSTWHQSLKGRRKNIPTNSCLSEGSDFLQGGMFKHALHVLKCCPPFLLGWRSKASRCKIGKTS